jgi:hypothetical protein
MPRHVVLSGEFGTDDVDALCAGLAPLTELPSPAAVRIDLSQLTGLSAPTLAVLVATLRRLRTTSLSDATIDYVPPEDGAWREYLSSTNLIGLLDPLCVVDVQRASGRGQEQICCCEPFDGHKGMERAVDATLAWLRGQQHVSWDSLFALAGILKDVAQNVLQHADIDEGVMAMKLRSESKSLEFAVVDRGIGIRRSLAKNNAFKKLGDDSVALTTALAPGCTSEPGEPGDCRGMGLFIGKLVLADNGGTLTVRSGDARIVAPSHEQDAGDLPSFDGTLVTATVPIDQPLNFSSIIRGLERIGGLKSVAGSAASDDLERP